MMSSFLLACFLLTLGLVVCQDGDLNFNFEGSGVGSGEEITTTTKAKVVETTKAPSRKTNFTTRIPDDTEVDTGSGEDGEGNVVSPTQKITVTDTDEITDEEISGSGGSGEEVKTTSAVFITTETPKETTSGKDPIVITEKATEKVEKFSTKKRVFTTKRPASTIGNDVNVVDIIGPNEVKTERPKTEKTKAPKTNKVDENSVEIINNPTTSSVDTEKTTTMSNSLRKQQEEVKRMLDKALEKTNGAAAQKSKKKQPKKKSGLNFTTGIIIGVVVGAVLAILIILFLVYRLRKKDEGSYLLEEPHYTGYAKQEPGSPTSGKEYFA